MPDDHDDFPVDMPKGKPVFNQDPHRVRELSERNLELAIGREVRACRRQGRCTCGRRAGGRTRRSFSSRTAPPEKRSPQELIYQP
jgi:hypothetical protein